MVNKNRNNIGINIVGIGLFLAILVGISIPRFAIMDVKSDTIENCGLRKKSDYDLISSYLLEELIGASYIKDTPPEDYSRYYSLDIGKEDKSNMLSRVEYISRNEEYMGKSRILFDLKAFDLDLECENESLSLAMKPKTLTPNNGFVVRLQTSGEFENNKNISKIFYAYDVDRIE